MKAKKLLPQELIDTYGRVHRDLRISVTDRCNFRCQYCMPEAGLDWLPKAELLTFEEIFWVAQLCVSRFGLDSIRLTGGEPTLRSQLPKLVQMLGGLNVDLAMTTNGVTLPQLAEDLKAAGLNRLNISLDSLRAERFFELTRRDDFDKVLAGIAAAKSAGFDPIKINMVVMRGVNDDEVLDFAEFGRQEGVTIRFIEFMPLDADEIWSNEKVVGLDEITSQIAEVFPITEVGAENGGAKSVSEPATRFKYLDMDEKNTGAEFGVIASVTQSFCHLCDRVRLTSDGKFRNCLFSLEEYDLREIMRSGANPENADDEMAEVIARAVHNKWAGHSINQTHFIRPSRSMSQIGG